LENQFQLSCLALPKIWLGYSPGHQRLGDTIPTTWSTDSRTGAGDVSAVPQSRPKNRGADTKVQIAATETLREISAVTRKKIALIFCSQWRISCRLRNASAEIYRVLFGDIVPVTFL